MFATIARFFQDGGPMMWIILGVLATALALIVERWVFLLRDRRDRAQVLAAGAAEHLIAGDVSGALADLGEGGGPARRLLRRAVELAWEGYRADEIRNGVEELAICEMPRYGRRLNHLAVLANIATLAGLLGTIFGLQQSFSSLAVAEAAAKAAVLAAGISQAMNTTAFGLMVAMPCLAVHSKLASLAERGVEDCDAAVVRLLNFLDARERASDDFRARSAS